MFKETDIDGIKDFAEKNNFLFKRSTNKSILISKNIADGLAILGEYFSDHVCDRITVGVCFDKNKDYLTFDLQYNLADNSFRFNLPIRFVEWTASYRHLIIEFFKSAVIELSEKIYDLSSLIDLLEREETSRILKIGSKDRIFYDLFWKTLFSKDYILSIRLLNLYLKYVSDSSENHDIKYAKIMLIEIQKENPKAEEIERIKDEWILANRKRSGLSII